MRVVILLMLARPPAVNAEALFDGPCGGVWLNLIAATGGFDQRRVKFTYSLKGVQLGSAKSWADVPFVGIDFERPFASHMFWRATAIFFEREAGQSQTLVAFSNNGLDHDRRPLVDATQTIMV
jgi:hypothetical protein